MGQKLATGIKSGSDLRKDDETWLKRDMSIAFDQFFVATIISSLPPLTVESILSPTHSSPGRVVDDSATQMQHFAEIFGLNSSSENSSMLSRDIPELDLANITCKDTLGYMRERALVLQRMYYAHSRRVQAAVIERNQQMDDAENEAAEELRRLATSSSTTKGGGGKGKEEKKEEEEDEDDANFPLSQPEGFFVASSIEMSLVLARSMAAAGSPAVVNAVCQTLLNLMEKSKGAIFDEVTKSKTWTFESLMSIEKFAKEISSGNLEGTTLSPKERSMGSALELALALQHGELSRLLSVAQQLLAQHGDMVRQGTGSGAGSSSSNGKGGAQFPASVVKFIQSIAMQEPIYGLDTTEKKDFVTSVALKLSGSSSDVNSEVKFSDPLVVGQASNLGHVYVVTISTSDDGMQRKETLQKIGTGQMGTELGRVYVCKDLSPLASQSSKPKMAIKKMV